MATRYGGVACCAAAMVIVMGNSVAAQTVKSFDELPSVIRQLDTLVVTGVTGQEVRGQLRSLTTTAIEVMGRDGASQTLDRANVQRIVLRDSISNGAQAGSLAGALPMLVLGLIINVGCRNEGGNCLGVVLGLTGLGAGIGAGLGAAIDSASHELVYDQTVGTPKTITQGRGPRISMTVARTRASLGMSYGW